MQGDVLLIFLVLVFGCAGFFFGVIYLAFRCVAWAGRGCFGMFRAAPADKGDRVAQRSDGPRTCPREQCRKVERRHEARYCGQCGACLS